MRSGSSLGCSLSDAHAFGPLNLEPVYSCRITRVSDCILHHVNSHHMTLLRSPCGSRRELCWAKEKVRIEHILSARLLGGTRPAAYAILLLVCHSYIHCCFQLRYDCAMGLLLAEEVVD